jgi:hypothetical protein
MNTLVLGGRTNKSSTNVSPIVSRLATIPPIPQPNVEHAMEKNYERDPLPSSSKMGT